MGIFDSSKAGRLRWHRTVAVGIALLFGIYVGYATIVAFKHGPAVDFISFWAAAKLTIEGLPWQAYDISTHHAVEETIKKLGGVQLPFAYPPPFLFFVTPFGLLPFWVAYAAWVTVTAVIYVVAFRRVAPLPYSLAHPGALINALIGQNGLLTSAIFVTGTELLEKRPFAAGLVLGILVIKPQIALLLPVAVLSGRYWSAIAGAALSGSSLLLAALLVFGPASYQGFFAILPHVAGYLEAGSLQWAKLASVFAFCRFLGIPQTAAYAIHWAVAAAAALITARAWWLRLETKVPTLAAATLLIPPYIWPYDSLLLMIPAGWMIARQRGLWILASLWLLCLLPMARFWGAYPGPNTVPLAAMLCVWFMHREANAISFSEDLSSHVPTVSPAT